MERWYLLAKMMDFEALKDPTMIINVESLGKVSITRGLEGKVVVTFSDVFSLSPMVYVEYSKKHEYTVAIKDNNIWLRVKKDES